MPTEQRGTGLDRDAVRLLVSRGTEVSHHAFADLPVLLTAGDEQRSGNDLSGTATLTNPNTAPMVATLSVTATTATGCTSWPTSMSSRTSSVA